MLLVGQPWAWTHASPLPGPRSRMNFDDTPEEEAWRERVRTFIAEHRAELATAGSGDGRGRDRDLERARRTQATLYDGGFVGVTWPKDVGGQGGTLMQQAIV